MKTRTLILTLFVLIAFCKKGFAQTADSLFIGTAKEYQMEFIAKFTGEKPIDESGTKLGPRSTPYERSAAASFLYKTFEHIGLQPQYHSYQLLNVNFFVDIFFAPFRGKNVYATIPATVETKEHIILGAHYDSEAGAPGAIDNATGVVLNLVIAKELLKLNKRTKHVMIVFFDQEEDDEIGSKAFAKMIKQADLAVHSVHISDLIGWDSNGDYAVETALANPEMSKYYLSVAEELNMPLQNTRVYSSDHKSFLDEGYQALLFSEAYLGRDSTPHIHTPADTYETVNFNYLASATQLMFKVIKQLIQE